MFGIFFELSELVESANDKGDVKSARVAREEIKKALLLGDISAEEEIELLVALTVNIDDFEDLEGLEDLDELTKEDESIYSGYSYEESNDGAPKMDKFKELYGEEEDVEVGSIFDDFIDEDQY